MDGKKRSSTPDSRLTGTFCLEIGALLKLRLHGAKDWLAIPWQPQITKKKCVFPNQLRVVAQEFLHLLGKTGCKELYGVALKTL